MVVALDVARLVNSKQVQAATSVASSEYDQELPVLYVVNYVPSGPPRD